MTNPRVRCLACATEQEIPEPGTAAVCEICETPLPGSSDAPGDPSLLPTTPEEAPKDATVPPPPPTLEQLLAAPIGSASQGIDELLDLQKRVTTMLSLVPVWGPWQLWQSDAHSEAEKIRWTAVSAALTLAILIGLAWLIPGAAERAAVTHARVEADFDDLAALVERYAVDAGKYPDAEVWGRTIERGDPRFIDPWNRTYHYRLEPEAFVLGTYGRDGRAGGTAEDADLSRVVPLRGAERGAS